MPKKFTKLEVKLAEAMQDLIDTFGLEEIIDTEEQAQALQNAQDTLSQVA